MTLSEFVRQNRRQIDAVIRSAGIHHDLTDDDREFAVLVHNSMARWAERAGVVDPALQYEAPVRS